MKTFQDFLTEMSHEPLVRSIVRALLEAKIDPVRYVYFRLTENVPPAPAAAGAGAADPAVDIKALTDQVTRMMQNYGQNKPEMGKVLTNMQKEVQGLQMAAQKDAQAPAAAGAAPAKPGMPTPGAPAVPGAAPAAPGAPPVPGAAPAKPGMPVPAQR